MGQRKERGESIFCPTGVEAPREIPLKFDRAREIFSCVAVVSTLGVLGYNRQQAAYAMTVLFFLQRMKGKMVKTVGKSYLHFEEEEEPRIKSLIIQGLAQNSFLLTADRDESCRGWNKLNPTENLLRWKLGNPVSIFDDCSTEVARFGLVTPEKAIDLDFLVPTLCSEAFTETPQGLKKSGRLTEIWRILGGTGTYRAAWIDEKTKLEFVAELKAPETRTPDYVAYRRLPAKEGLIPFGRKPNVTEKKARGVLAKAEKRTLNQSLVWEPIPMADKT